MVRAKNRLDAYDLVDMGMNNIYRETLHTSIKLAVDVMVSLGRRSYTATRQGQKFLKYDEEMISEMALHRHDMKEYVIKARETFKLQEELLAKDFNHELDENDHTWDSDRIREVIAKLK